MPHFDYNDCNTQAHKDALSDAMDIVSSERFDREEWLRLALAAIDQALPAKPQWGRLGELYDEIVEIIREEAFDEDSSMVERSSNPLRIKC